MNIEHLPDTASEVTPALLNRLLVDHPDWNEPLIICVEMHAMDSPRGTAYRAELTFEGGGHYTLMVKMHNPATPRDRGADHSGEVYFYREVALSSGVPVPKTYFAEWDEVTARQLIIQEFLCEGRIGTARRC